MDFTQIFSSFKNKTLWSLIFSTLFSSAFASNDTITQSQDNKKIQNESDKKEAILLVAFGSTQKSNAKKAYDNIEKKFSEEFKNKKIYWAYTSQFIRKRYAEKNIKKYSIVEALEKVNADGFKKVSVQSLHFTNGAEYNEMLINVAEFKKFHKNNFSSIKIGLPLVVSGQDLEKFSTEMLKNIPKERCCEKDAIIFVAHGNHTGIGDLTFLALQDKFNKKSKNVFVTSIEGYYNFSDTVNYVTKKCTTKKAYLMPLLITAGVHVAEDIASDDSESLSSLLKNKNIASESVIKGLGEYDNIVDMFVDHLKNAHEFNMK